MPRARIKESFEDQTVTEYTIAFTGQVVQPLGTVLHVGDEVSCLVTGTVKEIGFKGIDAGVRRVQKAKVGEMHLLLGTDGIELLAELRDRDKAAMDELLGRTALPFDDTEPGNDDPGA